MQAQPIEGGGFRGRTNKLVDGCYSWWNGGLFHFVEAYLQPQGGEALFDRGWCQRLAFELHLSNFVLSWIARICFAARASPFWRHARQAWQVSVPGSPFSKRFKSYNCSQRANDAYHTCYVLSGLSAAQHHLVYDASLVGEHYKSCTGKVFVGQGESEEAAKERLSRLYGILLSWKEDNSVVVGNPDNLIVRPPPAPLILQII